MFKISDRHFNDTYKHVSLEIMKSVERMTDIFVTGGMRFEIVTAATVQARVKVAGVMIRALPIPPDLKEELIRAAIKILRDTAREK